MHNGDLVATDARYHRDKNCYAKYIYIKSSAATKPESKDETIYHNVVDEFLPLINDGSVFLLTTLVERFSEMVEEEGLESDCSH